LDKVGALKFVDWGAPASSLAAGEVLDSPDPEAVAGRLGEIVDVDDVGGCNDLLTSAEETKRDDDGDLGIFAGCEVTLSTTAFPSAGLSSFAKVGARMGGRDNNSLYSASLKPI